MLNAFSRLSTLVAFCFATALSAAYFLVFSFLVSGNASSQLPSLLGHLGFTWVPVIFSACIQAYASIHAHLPKTVRWLHIIATSLLAPTLAGSMQLFSGFVCLGWRL